MKRNISIDALRGLAVLFMVQQHCIVWLWNEPWDSFNRIMREHPVMLGMNQLGLLAAPLFILLAGAGAHLFTLRHEWRWQHLVKRGLFIMGAGYLLNLLVPAWFGPGSFYVLQLIGFCVIISVLLLRLSSPTLVVLSLAILAATAGLQQWLQTPLLLSAERMNNTALPGGVLRLALVEGHFPVFPWLSFFCAGIVAGRAIARNRRLFLLVAGAVLLGAGLLLTFLYFRGYSFATYGPFYRLFVFLPYTYPAVPSTMLILAGISFMLLYAFLTINNMQDVNASPAILRLLAPTGRTAFSFFMLHIILVRQGGELLSFYKSFSQGWALTLIGGILAAIVALSITWKKYDYRFSLGWLMRMVT